MTLLLLGHRLRVGCCGDQGVCCGVLLGLGWGCFGDAAQVPVAPVCGGAACYSPSVFQARAIFLACSKPLAALLKY